MQRSPVDYSAAVTGRPSGPRAPSATDTVTAWSQHDRQESRSGETPESARISPSVVRRACVGRLQETSVVRRRLVALAPSPSRRRRAA